MVSSTSARSSEQGPVTPFTTHTLLPNGSSSKSNSSLPDMSQSSFVKAFFTLLILGGYLGMGLILLTIAFSSKVRRHPLFVNFLLCLMIYTTSFCFLLFAGHQFDGEGKPLFLCVIQVSFIYGSQVMAILAGLAMVFNVWLKVRILAQAVENTQVVEENVYNEVFGNELYEKTYQRHAFWTTIALLALPYLVFLFVAMIFILEGQRHPLIFDIASNEVYCKLQKSTQTSVPTISGMLIFIGIGLIVLVGKDLLTYRKRMIWPKPKSHLSKQVRFSLVVRLGLLMMCCLFSFLAAVIASLRSGGKFTPIVQALFPLLTFFIFGSQKDLLDAWGLTSLYYWIKAHAGKPPSQVVMMNLRHEESRSYIATSSTASTEAGYSPPLIRVSSPIRPPEQALVR
ncbi:hypothetical protein PNOK_0574700 [Pyrrhoderma noxium]|uniref:Uncharacterized protein n=1 Tax=Pyrrhoderma noxium TaxID=2282107 RepID=A0A286UHF0_9AGAM|nr:hypothetical protein PNOK_0574700 [Pyrrhoderma noxium]